MGGCTKGFLTILCSLWYNLGKYVLLSTRRKKSQNVTFIKHNINQSSLCQSNKLSSSLGFFYIDICYICFQNNISIMIFGKMYFVPCLNRVNANVYLPYESLPTVIVMVLIFVVVQLQFIF